MSNFRFCLRSCWRFDRSERSLRCRPAEARWPLLSVASALFASTTVELDLFRVVVPLLSIDNLLHLCKPVFFIHVSWC